MSKFIIEGGHQLKGEIRISGNKNSVLPCLIAALLTDDEVVLRNTPNISDVDIVIQVMESLGASISRVDDIVRVKAKNIKKNPIISQDFSTKLRASVLFAGALLSRSGNVEFYHPGGDVIGRRGIDIHLSGFKSLGYAVKIHDLKYKIIRRKNIENVSIFLKLATVTGTENIILASVIKKGTTIIRNAAQEPHVVDLCKLLKNMGADIQGIGTSELIINGVESLHGTEFVIGPDYMEFGTYAIAAAITKGKITLKNCSNLDFDPIIWPMKEMGINFDINQESISVNSSKLKSIPRLITNFWPGFPTDLMSVMIVLATQSTGISLLHDWIYESRMFFVDKIIAMGANITIADPHRVLVYGPTKLKSRVLETPDIRAGMALVLAALVADGESTINRAELIERGYANVVENLSKVGAIITQFENLK